jgi:hypothetical protein
MSLFLNSAPSRTTMLCMFAHLLYMQSAYSSAVHYICSISSSARCTYALLAPRLDVPCLLTCSSAACELSEHQLHMLHLLIYCMCCLLTT